MDIELIVNVLETKFHIDNVLASTDDENSDGYHSEHSKFWKMLGVNEKSSGSSTFSEIEDFLKFPRANSVIGPFKWWFNNKFHIFFLNFAIFKLLIIGTS